MAKSEVMLTNVEIKSHISYSLQVNRWFLLPIGAWPLANTSNAMLKILAWLHILVCVILISIIMLPCLLYILIEEKNVKLKLNAVGPLLHRVMGTVNYWTLIMRSDDIRKCIRHMGTDWRIVRTAEDRDIMMQHAKFGRFIASICAVIMQGGAFFFSIAKAVKTTNFTVGNNTYTMHPMTCPIYSKFIDTRFTPVNEIMLTVQFMSTFVASCSTVGACSLAAVFAMHACGQLNVLYVWLDDLAKYQEKGSRETQRKLAVAVEHHLRILSFIKCVESIMHKASLAELAGCTINMCLLGYYCIMAWQAFSAVKIISYIIVYASMCFNIFIFCYIGEVIIEQCKHVGEMAYMTNWYELPHKTSRGFVLIIIRSSTVIKITAGKLFQLSIATFGDVIKTSFAYLNLLRSMTM
ncbi:odorant receptor 82a-like [Pseudomyrmex gracilis]|uniref:odorant receptor 82a-like n=1 Tax=Pseudomyrmex gracilis TaxID=219809 RepID=UPI0009950024|nr:odorant receptor 82a-like [Pseudomyrmex gracilis]